MARRWKGVLAVEGIQTGDGRIITAGALRWAELPLPLAWLADGDQHVMPTTAPQVGIIETIAREGSNIVGSGTIDEENPDGAEVIRRMDAGTAPGGERFFVSIDADDWEVEILTPVGQQEDGLVEIIAGAGESDAVAQEGHEVSAEIGADQVIERTTSLRIRGATLCAVPAFAEAFIALEPVAVTAAAVPFGDLPLMDRDTAWDASAAEGRCRAHCSSDGSGEPDTMDWARYREGFFWVDTENSETFEAYKLGFADMDGDTMKAVPRGIFACAGAMMGGRGGVDLPESDRAGVSSAICRYYEKMAEQFDDVSIVCPMEAEQASVLAHALSGGPVLPPAAWFRDPVLGSLQRWVTVTPEGRVFGHLAGWRECHVGILDRCLTADALQGDGSYAHFLIGQVATADAATVNTGPITLRGGHASPRASRASAQAHYDDTQSAVADVSIGPDAWGIWFAGALRPGVTEEEVRVLRASGVSGDWRQIAGRLELIAVCSVNVPGFPKVRAAMQGQEVTALVAAGGLPAPEPCGDCEHGTPCGCTGLAEDVAEMLEEMRASRPALRRLRADDLRRRIG